MSDRCESFILAIDQGTTSTRAMIFDRRGTIRGMAKKEFAQYFPKPGWVEHDADEIWEGVLAVMRDALASAGVAYSDLAGVGITNQRETTVLFERSTGRPLHRAIVWQSRQTSEICDQLRAAGNEAMVRDKTGLVVDAYFSATKIRWLLDAIPDGQKRAERGEILFGTMDTWLIYHLTGGNLHATDHTNASRTMLYNLETDSWDDDLLSLLAIPSCMMPEIRSSSERYGNLDAAITGGAVVPIAGVAGDQHAALFGQACFAPGMVKNTYGTGCFLLMNTGERRIRSAHGLLTTVAWSIGGRVEYALEGSVFMAGAAIQWLRDGLKILETSADSERIARSIVSSEGVYVVPAFVGLGAPYWDMDARGAIYGLTRGTTQAHIVRATLESLAYQTRDVLDAMERDAGLALFTLRVDGGAADNNLLMQFQADLLGAPVERARIREITALGAAYLAGLAVGYWDSREEIAKHWAAERRFSPLMEHGPREALWQGWTSAVARTRSDYRA